MYSLQCLAMRKINDYELIAKNIIVKDVGLKMMN